LIAYSVGAAIGPVLAAFTMQRAGDHALFGFIGVVALLIGLFALWRMKRRAPVPIAEQGSFQAMPRTSPVAHELDPAADTSSAAANQATGDVAAASATVDAAGEFAINSATRPSPPPAADPPA